MTNVVRPMIQSAGPLPGDSLTRPSIQPIRLPTVDDTDTSTGGESPVLMRRRSYNNISRDSHNKARHSLPIRAGACMLLLERSNQIPISILANSLPFEPTNESAFCSLAKDEYTLPNLSFRSSRSSVASLDERRSFRQRPKHNDVKRKKEDKELSPAERAEIPAEEDEFDSESSFDRFSPVRKTTRRTSTRSLTSMPTANVSQSLNAMICSA